MMLLGQTVRTAERIGASLAPSLEALKAVGERMAASIPPPLQFSEVFADIAKAQSGYQALMDSFARSVPRLVGSYPNLASLFENTGFKELRASLLGSMKLPVVSLGFDADLLASFRATAQRALKQSASTNLNEVFNVLREAERAYEESEEPDTNGAIDGESRRSLLTFIAVLGLLFHFLANQAEILETAFVDLALLGQVLEPIWEYVVAVIAALWLWTSRSDG